VEIICIDLQYWWASLNILRDKFALLIYCISLQIVWSTITANGTVCSPPMCSYVTYSLDTLDLLTLFDQPFLSSLGFSKSYTALIWSIAPICGTLVQPYFGMISDQSRNSMGRRKPFMLGGAIAISISLLGFALSESLAHGFQLLLGFSFSEIQAQMVVKIIAVLWFCFLNIAIQPLQVASRAFIIENCVVDQQVLAHAWASRIQGVGSIIGLFLGSVPLPPIFPYGGLPQFSTLCLLVSVLLLTTVLISCFLVGEDLSRFPSTILVQQTSFSSKIADIVVSVKGMPRTVRRICFIQCFAWMGWFPFLMYYTT
jgi:solute carrier family 45, member 1/2/4